MTSQIENSIPILRFALEISHENDLRNLKNLASKLGISTCRVVGRHPNNVFEGFVWGGMIQ